MIYYFLQYGNDEFPQHDSPVAVARYASPKAGGTLYQPEPYFDSAGTWYASPNSAYAPQSAPAASSSTAYHHVGHSPHMGPTHGHDHYALSPGVSHMDAHLTQVSQYYEETHNFRNYNIVFFLRINLNRYHP